MKKKEKKEKPKEAEIKVRINQENKIFKYLPFILFAVLTVIMFREFIFSYQMLYGSDTIEAGVFMRQLYVDYFKTHHSLILWDPFIFGGMPYVDAMHGDTFYPLAILQFILPLYKALGWKLVLTIFFAGIFTFYCMRTLGFSRGVSIIGALAYMFSANLVSWVYAGHDGRMYVTSLLPLNFLFLEKSLRSRKLIQFILFGGTIGLLILANHPQLAYFAMWSLGLYFLVSLIWDYKDNKKITRLIKPVSYFLVALVLGIALSLVQILPPYIYVNKYSPRAEGGKGYEYSTSWSFHPEELVSQFVPEFTGLNLETESSYWGRNPFKINSDYGGIVPLLFAIIALVLVRNRKIWFFSGLGLLALIYSLGAHTPLFRLFYYFVPQVKSFRAPGLILFLLVFSVLVMALFGLEKILQRVKDLKDKKKINKLLLVVVLIFFGFAILFSVAGSGLLSLWNGILYSDIPAQKKDIMLLNLPNITRGFWISFLLVGGVVAGIYLYLQGKLKRSYFLFWIGALLFLDLWRWDAKFIQNFDYQTYFQKDQAIDYLKQDKEPYRALVIPGTYPMSNFLALYGIDEAFGYHGNELKRYDDFTEKSYLESARTQAEYGQRYLDFLFGPKPDLLNVKYLLFRGVFPDTSKYKLVLKAGDKNLYRNSNYLPRARMVYKYEVIKDKDKILQRLKEPDFDYRGSIVLEEEPGIESCRDASLCVSTPARVTENKINSLTVEAETDKPGLLVLSENAYPAWKALVDGKETKIYTADYIFRAIPLEKGKHKIELVYNSKPYNIGKTSSILTGLFYLFILGVLGVKTLSGKKGELKEE
ncbi:MAG: YfhO family protein [candidate division Zixibacteria bacterium]|nr:YfhO family protein [candidate division Zixibacteria bacterium]